MSLLKQTTLRYRGHGHLRFDLPATFPEEARRQLALILRRRDGIYRVSLASKPGKLSLRYQPELMSFEQALQAVAEALCSAATTPPSEEPPRPGPPWRRALGSGRHWIVAKSQEARETADALRIVARQRLANPWMAPGTARTVFNDLLILYLIKTHWSLVYRYWLRRPFEHKNHWVALTYLLFLLLRARRAHLG
ncbi:hypothetical protein [Methyloterricola oryzae]|uniref:hypothetical protein n=1 Tax=Methyloterricola oryzae TaxID=1495050 RepID=UPI0005EB2B1A|nr:hypothetical protein [Methyloterricola oryzae]